MSPTQLIETVFSPRLAVGGGLSDRPGGEFRVDATGWGILALRAAGARAEWLEPLQARLAREQGPDGRIWMDRAHPDCYWPTALAVLAWRDSPASRMAQDRAIRFLLESTGVHYPRQAQGPFAHDTLLKGWPWVAGTHSWIEPTVLGVAALQVAGFGQHPRVREAIRMIIDRQLPHGGWNYGNTLVFGHELRPMPESTGAALAVLARHVPQDTVTSSLEYLLNTIGQLRTPLSLGWSWLGLTAWGHALPKSEALVERCLADQGRYGVYDTSALGILFLAATGQGLTQQELPT